MWRLGVDTQRKEPGLAQKSNNPNLKGGEIGR
jgi:hypothetical protein